MKRFWKWMTFKGYDLKGIPHFKFLVAYKIEYLIEKAGLGTVSGFRSIEHLSETLDRAIEDLKEQ